MKVKELIELLSKENNELELKLAINSNWPYECGISHLVKIGNGIYLYEDGKSEFIDGEKIKFFKN